VATFHQVLYAANMKFRMRTICLHQWEWWREVLVIYAGEAV